MRHLVSQGAPERHAGDLDVPLVEGAVKARLPRLGVDQPDASLDDVVIVLREDRDLGLVDDKPLYARFCRVRELGLVAPLHVVQYQQHAPQHVVVELPVRAPRLLARRGPSVLESGSALVLPALGGGHGSSAFASAAGESTGAGGSNGTGGSAERALARARAAAGKGAGGLAAIAFALEHVRAGEARLGFRII